jgi:hypothetical protein
MAAPVAVDVAVVIVVLPLILGEAPEDIKI